MTKRVKLTIAAANTILRSIRWRSYSTEYQVMVKHTYTHLDSGKLITSYRVAHSNRRWSGDVSNRIWPQDSYRDALLEMDRLSVEDRANAVIFRIKTERPA